MKGDFTRSTFKAKKHYSSVRMQQGRLQLDSDWNALVDIFSYLRQTQAQDVIGLTGVPKRNPQRSADAGPENFEIVPSGADFKIVPGRIYVGGHLCQLEQEITYQSQPDHPNALQADLGDGQELVNGECYIAYLDVWQRHITAVDDPDIREDALTGIPDTATRTKTLWQVKLLRVNKSEFRKEPEERQELKTDAISEWEAFLQQRSQQEKGRLAVRRVVTDSGSHNQSLENRLYRIEIHTDGDLGEAQFKWSKDNGTVIGKVDGIEGNRISVNQASQDDRYAFEPGQWIEILSEADEKNQQPGQFVRLTTQTIGSTLVTNSPISSERAQQPNLKVRRWDQNFQKEEATLSVGFPSTSATESNAWQKLGQEGIEVRFAPAPNANKTAPDTDSESENESDPSKLEKGLPFRRGDYWLIPTRSRGGIEWPKNGNEPVLRSADGIQHHYSPLALLQYDNGSFNAPIEDYRKSFPALIDCLDTNSTEEFSVERLRLLDSSDKEAYGSLQVAGPEGNKLFALKAEEGASFAFLEGDVSITKSAADSAANLAVEGVARAQSFEGSGAALTGVVKTTGDATIDGNLTVNNLSVTNLTASGSATAGVFNGSGAGLTDVVKTTGDVTINGILTATALNAVEAVGAKVFNGSGEGLTGVVKTTGNAAITGTLSVTTLEAGTLNAATLNATTLNTTDLNALDSVSAKVFNGSGASLTGVVKTTGDTTITGTLSASALNANTLSTNTLSANTLNVTALNATEAVGAKVFNGSGEGLTGVVKTTGETTINGALTANALNAVETIGARNFTGETASIGAAHAAPSRGLYVDGAIAVKKVDNDPSSSYALKINPDVSDPASVITIGGRSLVDIINESNNPNSSSRTLKKDIEILSPNESHNLLQQLSPVKFKFRAQDTLRLGFIAEDVPDIVASADHKAIRPNDIIALLTGVIKRQDSEILALKQDVSNLRKVMQAHNETIGDLLEHLSP